MDDSTSASGQPSVAALSGNEGPLEPRRHAQNLIIFASLSSLTFLAAPIINIDFIPAALCKRLHTSDTIANLPSTVYLAMAWFPIVVAWLIPQARLLKAIMSLAYGIMAVANAVVALVLLAGAPTKVIIGALIAHAAIVGCTSAVTFVFNWEALDRGVSEHLRGKALGLAYGWGPAFAVLGSLGTQLLLEGKLFGWQPPSWLSAAYPFSYAALFGVCAVLMALSALLAHFYRIPLPKVEAKRESFKTAVLGGFKSVLHHRVLLIACAAYLLVYCGNVVQNNMSIFTKEAVGRFPEDLADTWGLRASFWAALGLLSFTAVLVVAKLPPHPRPPAAADFTA